MLYYLQFCRGVFGATYCRSSFRGDRSIFSPISLRSIRMGKQYAKRRKRVRRKRYVERKKAESRAAMKR